MTDVMQAHAKLTLSLRITGARADGLHTIDAHMVSLALHDTLTITPGSHGITLGGPFATGVPTDETNLVHKALQLANISAAIHIEKIFLLEVDLVAVQQMLLACCAGPASQI